MIVRLLPAALEDLNDAFDFYEQQGHGLGDFFLSTLEKEIDDLSFQAGIHPISHVDYHVKYSHRFPYAIFYYISEKIVFVDAVLDCRRDPEWISDRLN